MGDQLTLLLAVAPANRSASQEIERAWAVNLVSCSNISELYERFARVGFCGRTCPAYYRRETTHSVYYSDSWNNSGIVLHGECLTLNSSVWHSGASACFLSDILETGARVQPYCLSAKACAGILRRTEKNGKSLPEPLKSVLTALAHTHTQYGNEIAGTLTARADSSPCADRVQNVFCIADDNAHAAIDENICGTLKTGGATPTIAQTVN